VNDDLKRLAGIAAGIESQARELREEIERLSRSTPESIEMPAEPAVDDSEARIVAFSMVLDGKPREQVAQHLAEEFGLADSDALLDDLYARAAD
jgi:cytochrome c551/c552